MKNFLKLAACLSLSSVANAETKSEDAYCLAKNIYFEARNQDINGQIAVGNVTLNRVKDKRYPNSICEVVYQSKVDASGNPLRNKCQFSWYCDGKADTMKKDKQSMELSYFLAENLINGRIADITQGSTHYHTRSVKPYWRSSVTKITTIDDHIFYRWEQ